MSLDNTQTSFEHTLELATYHAAEVFTMTAGERRKFGLGFGEIYVELEVYCFEAPYRPGRTFRVNGRECGNEHGGRMAVTRAYAPVLHAAARGLDLKTA